MISFFYALKERLFPSKELKEEVFVSALEQSGDELASQLLGDLPKRYKNCFWGVAGKELRTISVSALLRTEQFAVMGFTDVLMKLPILMVRFLFLRRTILKRNPAICLLVDSPSFHLRLAKSLRMRGYKGTIIQYICPSVWLYKKKRTEDLRQYFDHVWGIFPFEKLLIDSLPQLTSLENPTLQKSEEFKKRFPVDGRSKRRWITLFPGSRKSEITLNLPLMVEAVSKLKQYHPNLQVAVSLCSEQHHDRIVNLVCQNPLLREVTFFDPSKNSEWMQRCLFAMAVSGTISLELACMEVPHLCLYKLTPLNAKLASWVLKPVPRYFTLPNIIAQTHEAMRKGPLERSSVLQHKLRSPMVYEVIGESIDLEEILVWLWKALDPAFNEKVREKLRLLPGYFSEAKTGAWARKEITKLLERVGSRNEKPI